MGADGCPPHPHSYSHPAPQGAGCCVVAARSGGGGCGGLDLVAGGLWSIARRGGVVGRVGRVVGPVVGTVEEVEVEDVPPVLRDGPNALAERTPPFRAPEPVPVRIAPANEVLLFMTNPIVAGPTGGVAAPGGGGPLRVETPVPRVDLPDERESAAARRERERELTCWACNWPWHGGVYRQVLSTVWRGLRRGRRSGSSSGTRDCRSRV